jgi:hypothetical protein
MVAEVAGGPTVVKAPLLGPIQVQPYVALGEVGPSASTLARTVGTGLATFPLGLTEAMVMEPPEPERPLPLLVADPVRLVALLTVRSTTLFGFGTYDTPYLCWVYSFNCYSATSSAPNPRR